MALKEHHLGSSARVRSGEVKGVWVRAEHRVERVGDMHTTVTRVFAGENLELPHALRLMPQGVSAFRERLTVGDDSFDAVALIEGPEIEVHARLGAATRRKVGDLLMQLGGEVRDGTAQYVGDAALMDDNDRLRAVVYQLVDVARGLGGEPATLLANNALGDPLETVRQRCLELLAEHFRGSPEARRAGEALLESGEPLTRIAAARACWPNEAARRVLAHHVAAGAPAERLAAVEAVGALRVDGVEPGLIELLTEHPMDEVRVAAARALGAVGSVHAVEPLLPCTRGLLTARDLKNAARDAIAAIQARLGDVEAGALTLTVDTPESPGHLTLAPDAGALSEVPPAEEA